MAAIGFQAVARRALYGERGAFGRMQSGPIAATAQGICALQYQYDGGSIFESKGAAVVVSTGVDGDAV